MNIKGNLMGKLLLDNIAGIAGETIKHLILIVNGVVLLHRVKNSPRELNTRVAALEHWRDEHISSIQPHTVGVDVGDVGTDVGTGYATPEFLAAGRWAGNLGIA